ncbi:GNAT superfamily N-acetyltransferase [Marmoricola sp. OAE513]|uniref:GNAT family N-acetyltransferase n=1 Tax=Marmoricola sp. OAE513 TaxID=2817894 RepID=UPI001AEA856D
MDIPLGWRTDLAVLRLSGAQIVDHGDHLQVTSPDNPTYYWGNFVLVTDRDAVDDPQRWLDVFEAEFPDAEHRAIGLVAAPEDLGAWHALTLFLEPAEVLVTADPIGPGPLADGYEVRPLTTEDDWGQSTRMRQLAFPDQDEFEETNTRSRVEVSRTGAVTWFGAFADGALAAELGIADCGDGVARYQSVLTHPDHRRRGLTRHLLAVAAEHARSRGATDLVIVADGDSDAGRLYRRAGFVLDDTMYEVSRVPGIEATPEFS